MAPERAVYNLGEDVLGLDEPPPSASEDDVLFARHDQLTEMGELRSQHIEGKRLAAEREKIMPQKTKKDIAAKKNANKKQKILNKDQLDAKKRKEVALKIKLASPEEKEAVFAKRVAVTAEKAWETAGNDA
ncbi:MAG: hypothetical protein Q9180_001681 [Flavoplaca navasiana]